MLQEVIMLKLLKWIYHQDFLQFSKPVSLPFVFTFDQKMFVPKIF
jgi:hypothetical protein